MSLQQSYSNNNSAYWVVIPAGGSGRRYGPTAKQFVPINGEFLITATVKLFLQSSDCLGVVLVMNDIPASVDTQLLAQWQKFCASEPRLRIVPGGQERVHSVINGLECVQELIQRQMGVDVCHLNPWVMVHDGARPCLHTKDLQQLIVCLTRHKSIEHYETLLTNKPDGFVLGRQVADTLKSVVSHTENIKTKQLQNTVKATVARDHLWHALTPQVFQLQTLLHNLRACLDQHQSVTDESQAMEICGCTIAMIEALAANPKLTYPGDEAQVEFLLAHTRV